MGLTHRTWWMWGVFSVQSAFSNQQCCHLVMESSGCTLRYTRSFVFKFLEPSWISFWYHPASEWFRCVSSVDLLPVYGLLLVQLRVDLQLTAVFPSSAIAKANLDVDPKANLNVDRLTAVFSFAAIAKANLDVDRLTAVFPSSAIAKANLKVDRLTAVFSFAAIAKANLDVDRLTAVFSSFAIAKANLNVDRLTAVFSSAAIAKANLDVDRLTWPHAESQVLLPHL